MHLVEVIVALGVKRFYPDFLSQSSWHNITRREAATSAESEDKTSDEPGDAAAANATVQHLAERGDAGRACSNDCCKNADATEQHVVNGGPSEPHDKGGVNVIHVGV